MTKYCSFCSQAFKATHKTIVFCSRACKWQSTYPATGERFGRFTIVGFDHRGSGGKAYFRVACDCGTVKVVQLSGVKLRLVTSCGCRRNETSVVNGKKAFRHGLTGTTEWRAFHAAKQRCTNHRRPDYSRYGGRGIKFCFTSFEEFYSHIGPKPTPHHSLDRINNDGNYELGNIRWATDSEQRRNKRPRRPNSPKGAFA